MVASWAAVKVGAVHAPAEDEGDPDDAEEGSVDEPAAVSLVTVIVY
jgi:hypothetical protein